MRLDFRVLSVTGFGALVATLLASGIPASVMALRSASTRWTGRAATADRHRFRAREAIVVVQVALALVLLVGSGLMARSMWRIRDVRPGFEPANVMTFRLALPPATYASNDDAVRFYQRLVDGISTLPSVEQAAVVSKLPLDPQGVTDTAVFVEGRPIAPGRLPGIHPVVYATPDYFLAAGTPLISGQTFTPSDPPRVVHEVVVSQALAQRYWPNESPLGKRLRILTNGPFYTVVGMAGNVRNAALDRARTAAVRRMVAFQGLRVAMIGTVLGLAGAAILTRSLSTFLYEVSPTDPGVLAAGALLVLFVAGVVSWIPTRRTTTINPAMALRAE